MTDEIVKIALTILASLGGGAIIVGGFAQWLGNLWATRLIENEKKKLEKDFESYRVKLKKSEFIFQKEYEAASEFVALTRSFLPTYSHPEMDWYDACDEIAHNFGNIEIALNNYISKHGAILKKEVKDSLSLCIGIAGGNKFNIDAPEISTEVNDSANVLYKKLHVIEEELLNQVHSQSTT